MPPCLHNDLLANYFELDDVNKIAITASHVKIVFTPINFYFLTCFNIWKCLFSHVKNYKLPFAEGNP